MKANLETYEQFLIILSVAILVIIDFLIFHDFFKESYTVTEYLTGLVSIIIIFIFTKFFIENKT